MSAQMSSKVLRAWHVAVGLAAIVGLLMVLWPLGLGNDYMNHLARTYIEGYLYSEPVLQQFYGISLDFIPDLTMDLIIPWLSQVIGIYPAGAVTIWLGFVLPPIAGLVLARALHGRVTWVSLFGFLTVFNANMSFGFVNFNVSIGFALLAFVLWIRMSPGWRRTVIFAPIGLVLVVNHALAFLMFGYLALVWELIQFSKRARGPLPEFLFQILCFDGPAMLGGLIFLGVSVRNATDLPQVPAQLFDLAGKVVTLQAGTLFGNFLIAGLVTSVIIVLCFFGIRNKWVEFADDMGWLCAALLALVVLMPTTIMGIWGLHFRFTALFLIVFGASVRIRQGLPKRTSKILTALCLSALFLTYSNGAVAIAKTDQTADEFRLFLKDLPQGSKLLVSFSSADAISAFSAHGASMAVIERQAFVPNLFTNTSPVDVTPVMSDYHMPQSQGFSPDELRMIATANVMPSANGFWSTGFANDWPRRWDYIVLFRTPDYPGLEDLPVCEVSAIETAILYKVGLCP